MTARHLRLAFSIAVAALAGSLFASDALQAAAKSRVCRQLEAELAAPSGGGSSAQVRKYDAAIERQRDQLAIARSQARDAGCGFALLSRNRRQCGGLYSTIDKMQRNLDSLQDKRTELGGRKGRSSARIVASLEANGCRDDEQVAMRRPPADVGKGGSGSSFVDRLLRGGIDESPQARNRRKARQAVENGEREAEPEYRATPAQAPVETFRTMCVRTCDGYMFPMSQAATVRDFERDQKNCESACPGADIQVFYRLGESEDTAEMVSSVTGAPYSQMPNANLYKDPSAPRATSCGCNPVRGFEVVAGTAPLAKVTTAATLVEAETEAVETAAIPVPTPRPDPAETVALGTDDSSPTGTVDTDAPAKSLSSIQEIPAPEPVEAANTAPTAGSVTAATPTEAPATTPDGVAERKIRVVGPAFLPDPAAGEVPQAQDPNSAR